MDGFTFKVDPPKAVTDYLGNKGLKPSFDWQDVWREEHAFAFTVAKATELNVLNDIFEEIQTSIADGTPFAEFKKNLKPKLKAKGWWGEKDVPELDAKGKPTGKTVKARLGSPRRLRTIYWANVRTARAAGQWQRIQSTSSILPYLSYELGPSEVHRPLHVEKQGIVLLSSDPFWNEWFAPNGWGCQCWHRQLGTAEAKRLGVSKAPKIRKVAHRNKRTGQITTAPEGIDPGWNINPGQTREANVRSFLAGALERSPPAMAQVAIKDLLGDSEFVAHMRGERLTAFPIAVLAEDLAELINSKSRTAYFSQNSAQRHHDGIAGKSYPPPKDFALIQEWLPRAAIYQQPTKPGRPPSFTAVFIAPDGITYWVGLKTTRNDELFLTTFFTKGRNLRNKVPRGEKIKDARE